MKTASFHIIRIGLGITFLWIGVLIIKEPQAWGGYLQPWVANLLPLPLEQIMITTAITDIAVGALFLIDFYTWIAALIAGIHLLIVLIGSGITDITVRDIGLFTATLAVFREAIPQKIISSFLPQKKQSAEKNLTNHHNT